MRTLWQRSYRMAEASMASWFSVRDVLDQLDDDNDGFSDDESDYEGEGIAGYLPKVSGNFL